MKPAVLHNGMGFDTAAWLIDYLTNPKQRQFDLQAVIMSQTGSESVLVKQQMESYIFPLLRNYQIRTVQIARASSSLKDGFVVLDDTTSPTQCFIHPTPDKPYWTLGEEMLISATIPQYSSRSRHCSEKFKIKILEKWHNQYCPGCQKIIGFNADEYHRIVKAKTIHANHQQTFPLYDKGWGRDYIEALVFEFIGSKNFHRSACIFCPFSHISGGAKEIKQRYLIQPDEGAKAAYLEYVALCFNPKQSLSTTGKSMIERGLLSQEAIDLLELKLNEAIWRVYEVRRIRGENIPYRSIKPLYSGTRQQVELKLHELGNLGGELKYCEHGIFRYHFEVSENREKYLVAAPGNPIAKERSNFQQMWHYKQLRLF
jgi:hypothetical protein